MSRRHSAEKREINPDAKFGNLVISKFMNTIMIQGKKSVAEALAADGEAHGVGAADTGEFEAQMQGHRSGLHPEWKANEGGANHFLPPPPASFLAPYLDRACLRSWTGCESSTPRMMW